MKHLIGILLLLCMLGASSCVDLQPTACDLSFISVAVEVEGGTLDKTYTINSAQDTISVYFAGSNEPFTSSVYTIINDSHKDVISNDEEEVVFHGYIDDKLVINETYTVGHDGCHVLKISGKEKIEL